MNRFNYYVLLELPFDPPTQDLPAIKAAIYRKRMEWVHMQETAGKRGEALLKLGLIPDIERVMLDSELRSKEAEAAGVLRTDMLREFEAELRIPESKGYITTAEAAALAAKYSQYGIGEKEINSLAYKPVANIPPQGNATEVQVNILDKAAADNIQRNLRVLDIDSLYDFLELPADTTAESLNSAAKKKLNEMNPDSEKNARLTAEKELAELCVQLFAGNEGKQRYDNYIELNIFPAVGEIVDEEFLRSKYIASDVMLRIINFAVEKYSCKVLEAEDYIRKYCMAYDIPVDSQAKYINCPACHEKTDRDGDVCHICAAPLRGKCPSCFTVFEGGAAVCTKCGFSIAGMVKGKEYISEAENALIESNWSLAQRCIAYAHKLWPGHSGLEPLERRAKRLEERYTAYAENIDDCIRNNRYYAAAELIEEAAARRIRLPLAMTEHVSNAINNFEAELAGLTADSGFEKLYEMMDKVSDSIELGRMLSAYPPEPVPLISVKLKDRNVRISWDKSPSKGIISYILVKKEDSAPLTAYDGEILYEGMSNFFDEVNVKTLKRYFYSVYVKRGNAYSESVLISKSVLIVPEVENLRLVPLDSGVRASWNFNPDLREVLVWRKMGGDEPIYKGDGVVLENPRLDGFSDNKLKNDTEYWYYIVAVYMVNGTKMFSRGTCGSVIPHKLLAPIDNIDIVRLDDNADEYVANWYSSQYNDVLILTSASKPEIGRGETVPVAELVEHYRNLDIDIKTPESARFRCEFSGGLYIFAAAVSGKYATVGTPRYITNTANMQNIAWDTANGDLVFNMKWPESAAKMLIMWRFDEFPKTPGETGSSYLSCTREQYEAGGEVIIKDPEESIYYCKIFSVFEEPGGETAYSTGVEMIVDLAPKQEIFYQIKYKKPLFSSAYTVSLTISADEIFVMPRGIVVGKIGRLPLRKTDGMPLFEIEKEAKVTGSITYRYRTSLLPKDLHVKLFLREDEKYSRMRLIPTSSLKIN